MGSRTREACRCDDCREAARLYARGWRRSKGIRVRPEGLTENRAVAQRPVDGRCPNGEVDGRCPDASRAMYQMGCRSASCRRDNRDYMRGWLGIFYEDDDA